MGYTVHGILWVRILKWVAFPFSRRSSQPGFQTQVPTLQEDFLPAEPQGKPKNTGVGSPSLCQQIFLTKGSGPGSPALQLDSLPAELPGKHLRALETLWHSVQSMRFVS